MKNNLTKHIRAARVSWHTSEVLAGIFRMASLTVILNFALFYSQVIRWADTRSEQPGIF